MKLRSYRKELEKATAQLLDVFNDIVIDRQDDNGVQQLIRVPCVYGDRSRVLKSLENRNKTVSLPVTSISMGSVARDKSRVFGIHDGLFYTGSTNSYVNNMPVPVNISFEYNIYAKFQDDFDMLISNWAVWYAPDIFVTIPISLTKKLKCQIVWDQDISISYPSEINDNQPARFVGTTNFVFKTYLFPGLDGVSSEDRIIYEVIEDFYGVPQVLDFDTFFASVSTPNEAAFHSAEISAFTDHLRLSADISMTPPVSGYVIEDL